MEMILGYLEQDGEFSQLIFDAFATPEAVPREHNLQRLADALAEARGRYQNVKMFDEAFFRNELGV